MMTCNQACNANFQSADLSVIGVEHLNCVAVGIVYCSCSVMECTFGVFKQEGKWGGDENRMKLEDVLQYC